MKQVSATDAKAKFSELLTAVESGDSIEITRHGKVIARLMPDESIRRAKIDEAIAKMREIRARNKPVTVKEMIEWKNEGRR